MRPKVSAIIANRNGAEHLRVCLPSLFAQSYQPIEIVVVDNGSSDGSEAVSREFGARWLPLGRNVGLAPALNRGAAVATGDLLLFVNNDMRFDREFVSQLASALDQDPSAFAADGMQFNWDGTLEGHLATYVARTPCGHMTVEIVPGLFLCQKSSENPTEVFMASAASMLVRVAFFELLRGFDERLPLSYEDVEICWRAWLRGWKTVYVPKAVCWHRVGASSRTTDEKLLLFRGVLRGRLLIATKYLPIRYALTTWIVSLSGLVRDTIGAEWGRIPVRWKEIADSASLARRWFREKNDIYEAARTTPARQLEFFMQMGSADGAEVPSVELSHPAVVSDDKWTGASSD
ncbi:MAG TPA: glycosyltransferase family 2 protein [Candidatus Acidoferrales bacterium]|nr:glycosyltransferase family 2 protein [Candidatus Acidoferrales bacterium]